MLRQVHNIGRRRAWVIWSVGLSVYVLAVFHRTSLGVAGLVAVDRFSIGAGTYDPQAAMSTDDNKARSALTEGSEVYLVIRRGLDGQDTAFAVGQYVDVWKVKLGPQNKTQTGDGDQDEYSITQAVIALSPPVEDVQIVA